MSAEQQSRVRCRSGASQDPGDVDRHAPAEQERRAEKARRIAALERAEAGR